jgi:hypothetical protein
MGNGARAMAGEHLHKAELEEVSLGEASGHVPRRCAGELEVRQRHDPSSSRTRWRSTTARRRVPSAMDLCGEGAPAPEESGHGGELLERGRAGQGSSSLPGEEGQGVPALREL